jgi:dihydropteroate synthase
MSPLLMGIVNVTPDSFSDGGRFTDPDRAVAHALRLLDEGADWLDIGGESTRPGAKAVTASEELDRVVPVIARLHDARPDAILSVDTAKAEVAAACLRRGATIVNDVTSLADPEMAPLLASADCRVVLMHMRGTPASMQANTRYRDLVDEVVIYLSERVEAAVAAGIGKERLLVDPGLGFGKAPRDNPILIRHVGVLKSLGVPVLVGASRKRFIGALTGVDVASDRVHGSVGAALAAAACGADVLRVHDVAATRAALDVFLPSMGLA